ncbi:MAG: sugar ABC transporter ATP-binding protein [Verrucomicrobia bacterium]|nr:sugar ABC transporter ATP-binding protein [Verrucomicrobiota bacterium]
MTHPTSHGFVLEVRNLSKSFPGVRALDSVQLAVRPASVHALMGENGAGKSTLMRLVAGLDQPDAGELLLRGQRVRLRNPHHALKLGVAMIHQELLPFPDLSVAENIFMGQEPAVPFLGWINQRKMNSEAQQLLSRLGVALAPVRKMRELSVAEMQAVEIAKALAHRAEVIIMDEPTSALSDREAEALFGVIRDLKSRGVAVIYISHKMDEVFRIADTVTVLRDGQHVGTCAMTEMNRDQLIALMVGRELRELFPKTAAAKGDFALSVRRLGKAGRFQEVSFDVRRGEVLGLAGLMGAGRTDLVSALFGLPPADTGKILVHGREARIRRPADAMRHGIGFVSEDRKAHGLVLPLSVKQNVTLASLRRCCHGGFINPRRENTVADECIREFSIKTPGRSQPVSMLSGGNQQKVVLAKALLTQPEILLLDEPTRGIDIGAKAEVYALVARLAQERKAILLVSSELPELLALSDRILVMRAGDIAAELNPDSTTPEEILKHAMPG